MATQATPERFGILLQRHRLAAGFSQEELAERAGLSRRGISDLERGTRRTPYADTVRRLADALRLDTSARAQLEATAHRVRDALPDVEQESSSLWGKAVPLTTFVGRQRELASVKRLLSGTRLLTLVGTGGVGKTRLALELVHELAPDYPDGVSVVELASLADPGLVPQAVASALSLHDEGRRSVVETLVNALRHRRVLLVIDNCEHLLAACSELVHRLLTSCPELHVLATSREPLMLAGEWRWRVPSLSLPDPLASTSYGELEASEAVRLFIDRAQAVLPDFGPVCRELQLVGEICRRLDGIPLAIELAAPLVSALSLDQIADHLQDRFGLLTRGTRESLPRHRTLRAIVDWSYDLLEEPERQLFQRLSVFAGRWTLEAAQQVCAGGDIDAQPVVRLLVRLVDQSLVVADTLAPGIARYRLLETLRQYAHERLLESGMADAIQRQHALYYTKLAEQADPQLRGSGQRVWHARLEADLDDHRAALRWWIDRGEGEPGLRLAGALGWYWYQHSYLVEGRSWSERLLALALPTSPSASYLAARLRTLFGAGVLALQQGDFAQARAWHAEGLRLAHQAEDQWGIAWSLQGLGHTYARTNELAAARAYLYESLAQWRALGHRWGEAFSLNWLANAAYMEGDLQAAWDLYSQALAIRQEVGDLYASANTLETLGRVRRAMGDFAAARGFFEQALAVFRDLGHPQGVARAHLGLGRIACARGDHAAAAGALGEALRVFTDVADRVGITEVMEAIAALVSKQRPARAANLLGAADSLRTQMAYPLAGSERAEWDLVLARIRADLPNDTLRAAWNAGGALDLRTAIQWAKEELNLADSTVSPNQSGTRPTASTWPSRI